MNECEVLYNGEVILRKDAKLKGLIKYFTGNQCKHGHIDQRYTGCGGCVSCGRDKSLAYSKTESGAKYFSEYGSSWRTINAEHVKNYKDEYRKNNRDKMSSYENKRRAMKSGSGGTYTKCDITNILERQKYKCAEPTCEADITYSYHVDHIMPLSLGGSNWPRNLQCMCPTCNLRKQAKHPIDWANENGRLV